MCFLQQKRHNYSTADDITWIQMMILLYLLWFRNKSFICRKITIHPNDAFSVFSSISPKTESRRRWAIANSLPDNLDN